jgi:hypothetical protein
MRTKSEKIADARRGQKWPRAVKAKIGAGVRHGSANKVPFNTRISAEAVAEIKAKAAAAKMPVSQAVERAIAAW